MSTKTFNIIACISAVIIGASCAQLGFPLLDKDGFNFNNFGITGGTVVLWDFILLLFVKD